jgi:uncharacterized protein YbaA (DUF1428 family)
MAYIDGFVLAVPAKNKAAYRKFAKEGNAMFRGYGATRIVEGWGDDVPKGKWTDFFMAVKAKKGETIVFSWIEWPSKKARNAGMKKMMADPRMKEFGKTMPFDGKRMIFGGFAVLMDF